MRRASSSFALTCLSLLLALPSAAQSRVTPDSLADQYMQSMEAKNYAAAVSAARQLVALDPAVRNLLLLAEAQSNTTPYADALATYDRAFARSMKEKPLHGQDLTIWNETLARIWRGRGDVLFRIHRSDEAVEAYQHFAKYVANPGLAYFNLCVTLYKSGDTPDSLAFCRKSLTADPKRADAWFLLGSVLLVNSPLDSMNKPVISAESRQALETYLKLAPFGSHAGDVKTMLRMAQK